MGDFEVREIGSLRGLQEIFSYFQSPKFRHDLLVEIAEEAIKLVEEEFQNSHDPYGRKWAPLSAPRSSRTSRFLKRFKRRTGRHVLMRSGLMAQRIKYRIEEDTIKMYSMQSYWHFHQTGTKKMPQRLIFPEELIGLPKKWQIAFDKAANAVLQRVLYYSAFQ